MFGFNRKSHNTDFTVAKSVKLVRDTEGKCATSLTKVEEQGGLSLKKTVEAMGSALKKHGASGIRAQVVLVVDHSGSMYQDYANGSVQSLAEKFLAFGLQVDEDGIIPLIKFDSYIFQPIELDIVNYKSIIKDSVFQPNKMGSTNLAQALESVREIVSNSTDPVFCAVLTDGEPDDKEHTTEIIKDLSRYPVFLKFITVRPVRYLQQLDDMSDSERLLDNVDTKSFTDASRITDEEFADAMADEWNSWVEKATKAGILI